MILAKIHKSENSKIICLCDSELLGRKFSDEKLNLDVSARFYGGEPMRENEISELLKDCNNLNIVGEKSIALALKLKKIERKNIITIGGVPHAIAV